MTTYEVILHNRLQEARTPKEKEKAKTSLDFHYPGSLDRKLARDEARAGLWFSFCTCSSNQVHPVKSVHSLEKQQDTKGDAKPGSCPTPSTNHTESQATEEPTPETKAESNRRNKTCSRPPIDKQSPALKNKPCSNSRDGQHLQKGREKNVAVVVIGNRPNTVVKLKPLDPLKTRDPMTNLENKPNKREATIRARNFGEVNFSPLSRISQSSATFISKSPDKNAGGNNNVTSNAASS
eukprot:CAMPEP_0167816510 /NCGR_PEP_ID=MMETSP0112_2-20121227/3649_1 /TAXON_ID=91324 /ORGANISM="Lotharella globosa, Strain CCCM811" /LENGTH=236 /DNA_ID=CAMNT_0007716111 /DNA_START=576 /DNA_END=1286 /DNA_ORIENTATION=+